MSAAVAIIVDDQDNATLPLRRLMGMLTNRRRLNEAVGIRCGDLTRRYILETAAPSRHKTALRLGASFTNYLSIAGQSVVSSGDDDAAEVRIERNTAIFARVAGPVTVRPVNRKWLTLPARAATYGRRAGEFEGLSFRMNKAGKAMLVKAPKYARKSDGSRRTSEEARAYREQLKSQTQVMFWLRKSTTLTADRGLLPSEAQYFAAIEAGVQEAARIEVSESAGQADRNL